VHGNIVRPLDYTRRSYVLPLLSLIGFYWASNFLDRESATRQKYSVHRRVRLGQAWEICSDMCKKSVCFPCKIALHLKKVCLQSFFVWTLSAIKL